VPALEGVDPRDREEVVRAFLAAPIVSKPGEKWEYSNLCYVVLGVIIEKLSGKTYEGYCEEQLFEPAGMKDAGFVGDGKIDLKRVPRDARGHGPQFAYGYEMTWGYRGCGGAVASVRDMLLWHQALSGTKILSDAAKREYYTVGLNNYALGWEVSKDSGRLTYAHSGHTGKVVTYFLRDIDDDIVVALACNEEPATHPQITASNLAVIARKTK
jgi:CubicO group peptidase (beta-lactamase class C family)